MQLTTFTEEANSILAKVRHIAAQADQATLHEFAYKSSRVLLVTRWWRASAILRGLLVFLLCLTATGCGQPFWLPPAHKIEVQQGNLISDEQRLNVNVGDSREQVLGALGQPVTENIFHENRWDYLYTKGPAGSPIRARRLTVYFENNKVSKFDDNYVDESGELPLRRPWWRRIVKSDADLSSDD